MVPFVVLVVSASVFWLLGKARLVGAFQDPGVVLRSALALMFALTASAHWGKRRPDLIRMVPAVFPRPDLLVTITGLLEILGVIGLLLPMMARATCICLAVLLVVMFPANIRAARQQMTIAGQRVPSLPVRSLLQIVFIGTLIVAASLK